MTHSGAMVALMLPPDLAEDLAIPGGVPAEELHVTLAYLGQADDLLDVERRQLLQAVDRFTLNRRPLEGEIAGVGRFTANDPDILWASVDIPDLPEFREALVKTLEREMLPVAHDHGFTPHITLAELPKGAPSPLETLDPIDLRFDQLTVMLAGERHDFELRGTMRADKQATVGSLDWAREEIIRLVRRERGLETDDDGRVWVWVRELFPDVAVVIVEQEQEGERLFEYPWTFGADGESVMVGEPREVTIEYVPKDERGVLGGPIVGKNAKKQIAYAPVLVPGEPDSDGDTLTASKIEDVAHEWMVEYQNVDLQHSLNNVDAAPVESYLSPVDQVVKIDGRDVRLPQGTWILGTKIRDAGVWEKVEKGELTGYSIMGVPRSQLAAALKSETSTKRTTLADIERAAGDWVAPFVSIVDRPAVPKAKFFALKSAESDADSTGDDNDPGLLNRMGSAIKKAFTRQQDPDQIAEAVKAAAREALRS